MKWKLMVWGMLVLLIMLPRVRVTAQDTIRLQWSLPLPSLKVTSDYGHRIHPVTQTRDFHKGIDLSARCDPVLTVLDGTVVEIAFNPILGRYVRIDHGDLQSIYGHLSFILVDKGESISAGQPIAITGATGRVTGEHLHFSIRFRGRYINPIYFLWQLHSNGQSPQINKQ